MLTALRGDDPLAGIVERAGLPAVYGGRPLQGDPRWYVDVDNGGGAQDATDHLIELGRTRIAMITGLPDTEVEPSRASAGIGRRWRSPASRHMPHRPATSP